MFNFEKLSVYTKAENIYQKLNDQILSNRNIDLSIKNQLKRAALSIVLNIAEGAGKYSKRDKKNFYTISRGSLQECVAALRILKIDNKIDEQLFQELYSEFTEVNKMLSGLIKSMIGK